MPEQSNAETSPAEVQAAPAPTSAAPAAAGQEQAVPTAESAKTFDLAYVESLRTEAANYRTKLREAEKKLKTEQTVEDRVAELEKQLSTTADQLSAERETRKKTLLESEIKLAAAALGFTDPRDALERADQLGIEFDDAGRPSNVEAALKALIEQRPHYVRAEVVTNPTNPPRQTRKFTREQIEAMSIQDYLANKDAVNESMAGL